MHACLEMLDHLGKFISMNVFSTRVNVERETEETQSRRAQRKSSRNVWFTSTSMWMKTMEVCVSRSERFFPTWQHTCILVKKKKKTTELKSSMINKSTFFRGCSKNMLQSLLRSSTAGHERAILGRYNPKKILFSLGCWK